jgi:peroxiredoxin
MAEVQSTFRLHPGDGAPPFALPDPAGAIHTLTDVAGACGLLVVFACNHCPFVVHLANALGRFAEEIAPRGVGTVAINSNDIARYPADAPQHMAAFAAAHEWNFPYLFDETQETARAYDAACTPDFYLFDGNLKLYYAGQFDATRPHRGIPDGRDLRAAVTAMLDGVPPSGRWLPSSGCSIKWRTPGD